MKAVWSDKVIAEADKGELIYIEGNWYFPPESIKKVFFKPSPHHTNCYWKGEASYYHVDVEGSVNENAAWYYPALIDGAVEKAKQDFTSYVAFWHGVTVQE